MGGADFRDRQAREKIMKEDTDRTDQERLVPGRARAHMSDLMGVLLAGGRSSRMGQDKATLQLPGRGTVLEHLLGLVAGLVPQILVPQLLVSVRCKEPCAALADSFARKYGVPVRLILDRTEEIGPMGGLYTSLLVAREAHCTGCLVLSCDVPLLVPGLLARLVEHREQHPEALVTALQDARGWLHPLIALWSVQAIAFLERAMTIGDYSLRRAVPAEHWQAVACTPREELSLANANTPQEWQHICALLEQGLPAEDRS